MKKVIIAFAAGQGLQILLLFLSENLTYSDKALGFCAGVGIIVLVALIVGAWGAFFAPAPAQAYKVKAETPKHHRTPQAPDRAKLKEIFPHWMIEDVADMDEVAELPAEISVTNDAVKREAADV